MPNGGHLYVEVDQRRIEANEAKSGLEAGTYLLIRVKDSGSGMPACVAERAFEPFFTTKPLGSATGLGISMVRGFARQFAGEAEISSQMGIGTAVSLLLPIHQGRPQDSALGSTLSTLSRSTVSRSQGTVMVVDDEATIRELISEALTDAGYHVIQASTAIEALERLGSSTELDLLITDIGLAGSIDGDALAKAAVKARPNLKVLFISGYAESMMPKAALGDGKATLLPKPLSMAELRATADQLLRSN